MTPETRNCKTCKQDFIIESDDFDFYKKINVPAPTVCPHCRLIRRLNYRNERSWYRRTCAATGKSVLSMYHPSLPLIVYDEAYWKSDAWDPIEYGRDFDFSRPFFEQFFELFTAVPHPNLIQKNTVGSPYSNYVNDLKNCYFCASSVESEDCSYLFGSVTRLKNSIDIHFSIDSEYCYELIDCKKCNRTSFAQNCEGCVESALLYDCRNVSDCFGCVGLRSGQYLIFNQQYSKEEYQKKLAEYKNGSRKALESALTIFNELKIKFPHKYAMIINAQNVSGDDLWNCRNCFKSFSVKNTVENCKYGYRIWDNVKDGWDGTVVWHGAELFYDVVSVSGQRIYFSGYIWGGNDIEYSYNCFDCHNIFGCVGLRSKQYCIFNKQYSKEEYEALVAKLKDAMRANGEYGEFFPIKYSPFAYNETIAQDYFSITKEEALKEGYVWREPEEKKYTITMQANAIPDSIAEATDDITKEVLGCEHGGTCNEHCATAFKITADELQFYRTFKLPLPRLCPNCRHYSRVKMKTPLMLWPRACMCTVAAHGHADKCSNEFETSYAPDRAEIVYCEACYQKEVL